MSAAAVLENDRFPKSLRVEKTDRVFVEHGTVQLRVACCFQVIGRMSVTNDPYRDTRAAGEPIPNERPIKRANDSLNSGIALAVLAVLLLGGLLWYGLQNAPTLTRDERPFGLDRGAGPGVNVPRDVGTGTAPPTAQKPTVVPPRSCRSFLFRILGTQRLTRFQSCSQEASMARLERYEPPQILSRGAPKGLTLPAGRERRRRYRPRDRRK